MSDRDRSFRGFVSISLGIAMLALWTMAGRVFPPDVVYVMPLFVFSAAIFMADAAVTFTRLRHNQAALDRERDRLAAPWRVAFALSFVLALLSASRTGPSFVTTTAVVLAVAAASIYLWKRRFFAILQEQQRAARRESRLRTPEETAAQIEKILEEEKDPSRRTTLLLSLGTVQVFRGAYLEAVRVFEKIDRRRREGAIDMALVVDLNVSSAYVAMGDFESAELAMARIDEKSVPAIFRDAYAMNRSAILVGKGAHAESIRYVETVLVEEMPESSRLPFLRDLAESLAASGTDTRRAMEVATRCLSIDAGPQSHNVLGLVLIAERKFEEACRTLDEALRLNPEGKTNMRVFAESWLYRGRALRAKGDAAAAKESFERAASVKGGGRFALAAVREAAAV